MAKIKKLHLSNLEGEKIHLVGVVCHIPDYRLSHFINSYLNLRLKKFGDFSPSFQSLSYSWYYYFHEEFRSHFYLIANRGEGSYLLPQLKNFDYLFFVKGAIPEENMVHTVTLLRNTPTISAAYTQEITKIKRYDELLEALEIHEMKEILIPGKVKKYPNTKI